MEKEKLELIKENKQIAESTLAFQSTYRKKMHELVNAKDECLSIKRVLDSKITGASNSNDINWMNQTLSKMEGAMAEAEEASEQTAFAFLNKQISLEQFLEVFILSLLFMEAVSDQVFFKEFSEKRQLYHSRRIKADRMPEEICKVNSSVPKPVRRAPSKPESGLPQSFVSPPYPSSDSHQTPYPITNPFAMPPLPGYH